MHRAGHAALIILFVLSASSALAQQNEQQSSRADEQVIEDRDREFKGIEVGAPKVYDDSLLQQMLNAAETRLASLQILDQTGIAARLGSVTGATQSVSSFALSIQGSPLPQIATTNTGPTSTTQLTNGPGVTVTGTNPSVTTTDQTVSNTAAPTTSQTITAPQVSPPAPTPPAATTALPSSFSVSASDLLNEQMQLTYEIANLRLLLEGSLTDRMVGTTKMVKPRVTLGFPISIVPMTARKYRGAIAFVEVEVSNCAAPEAGNGDPNGCQEGPGNATVEPPAVMALLPQEKTYNVASIKESDQSLGAGIVTQVVGVGASFFHGHSAYYLIKDQDTLALTFSPSSPDHSGFLWQFRPVLGERYVREGLKQTFVQLAFDSNASGPVFGYAHVRTYWRAYDQKHNLVKGVIPGSLHDYGKTWPINYFSLAQIPKSFSVRDITDLGNGQVRVSLTGSFLGGTSVRIGSALLQDGSPNFHTEYRRIWFVAPVADLATQQVALVSRDGSETRLVLKHCIDDCQSPDSIWGDPWVTPVDDMNTRLTMRLRWIPKDHRRLPLVIVIGGRAFGYSDAPITIDEANSTLSIVLPTAFLRANRTVTVRSLFTDDRFWSPATVRIKDDILGLQPLKLTLVEQADNNSTYLLQGNLLRSAEVIAPRVKTTRFGLLPPDQARRLVLTKAEVKEYKTLVIRTGDGLLATLSVPSGTPEADPGITPLAPVLVGTDEIVVLGKDFSGLQNVLFNGIDLKLTRQSDNKAVWLDGLRAAGATATAKTEPLEFDFKDSKAVVNLSVVAGK